MQSMEESMAATPRRSRTRALIALNLASFEWSVGLGAATPFIPILSHTFRQSFAAAGFVTAAGGMGRLFISYFAGHLMDKFGKRRVALVGIFIRMIFSFMEGLSRSYPQLVIYRLMSGVGTAIWGIGLSAMTADIAKRTDRGILSGLRSTMMGLGQAIGPILGGVSWQATGNIKVPFFINGFSKLAVLITILFVMRETGDISDDPSPATGEEARGGGGGARAAQGGRRRSELVGAVASIGFLFVIFALFGISMFREGIENMIMPIYARVELGLSESQTGAIISAISFGTLVSSLPAGYVTDRWGVRTAIIPGAIVAATALFLLGRYTGIGLPLFMALGAVVGVGTGIIQVASQAYAIDLSPPGARGRFFAVNQGARHVTTLVGPLSIGALADATNVSYPFFLVAALILLIVPASLVAVREKPRERQTAGESPPPG